MQQRFVRPGLCLTVLLWDSRIVLEQHRESTYSDVSIKQKRSEDSLIFIFSGEIHLINNTKQ